MSRQESLTTAEIKQWDSLCLLIGQYSQLAGFHILPKFHLMCHLASQLARTGAPRFTWVYLDESKNQYLSTLGQVSSKGPKLSAPLFAEKVMERWECSRLI